MASILEEGIACFQQNVESSPRRSKKLKNVSRALTSNISLLLVIARHLETRSFISAFDIETFVGFLAVQDRLGATCQQCFGHSGGRHYRPYSNQPSQPHDPVPLLTSGQASSLAGPLRLRYLRCDQQDRDCVCCQYHHQHDPLHSPLNEYTIELAHFHSNGLRIEPTISAQLSHLPFPQPSSPRHISLGCSTHPLSWPSNRSVHPTLAR